ncbi:MAG: helicase RepA family protein [Treponema sp.]|nr:helicase RepA family protein [Treponema sp.]
MTKQQLTEALKPIPSGTVLIDFLLGLPETELAALPITPLKRHALANGIDLDSGELAELLKTAVAAEQKRPHFVHIRDIPLSKSRWVIKNILEEGSLAMLYAPPGLYKSFMGVSICGSIAGNKNFYGFPVKNPGPIVYIAGEGKAGIVRRFHAWAQENAVPLNNIPVYLFEGAADLLTGTQKLIDATDELIESGCEVPRLAVVDTLSRVLGGDDSDTQTAAEGLRNIDAIRARFPSMAVLLIHHTGHQARERARGWSGWRAAMDAEFALEKMDDKTPDSRTVVLTMTKSKDSEAIQPMAFEFSPVNLIDAEGAYILNEDNEIESSGILKRIEYVPPGDEKGLGKNQENILAVLHGLGNEAIEPDEVYKQFDGRRDAFNKALAGLEERKLICREYGLIRLTGPKKAGQ